MSLPDRLPLAPLALLALAAPAFSQTLYVDVNGVPPGTGTQGDPYTSIQTAIDNASLGITIEVAPGTYVGDLALTHFGLVRSTAGALETIIESDGSGEHAVHFLSDSALEGFTITGVTDASKSGVHSEVGNIGQLTGCIVAGNAGPGVSGDYDTLIHQCTIAFNGGPGMVMGSGFVGFDVRNSIVRENGSPSSINVGLTLIEYTLMQGESSPTFGAGVFSLGAQFWSNDGSDLHLKPGSPAIDAGQGTDPDGSPLDLGALTFDPVHAPVEPTTYCTSKTNSQGCVPAVSSTGVPSLSGGSFSIDCSDVINNKSGLFFFGFAGKATPYQGGYLCVVAPVRRTQVQDSGGGPPPDDCSGAYSFDFGALLAAGSDPMLVAGQAVFGQFWYRDPAQSGIHTTGRSEAIGFLVAP